MQKLLYSLFICLAVLGLFINTADAARFGGGRSFGVQRSISGFSRQSMPPQMYPPQTSRRSWAAPLAGLALGSVLGYLLMGHGVGSGLLSWLAIFALGLMIWNFLRVKLQPAQASQAAAFTPLNDFASGSTIPRYPAGFDADSFLREAKVQFIRLQAAYDAKDMNDLREFTAPEVFAEIQLQLQERGEKPNHTEVISLNADLLNTDTENQATLASVKFSGVLREAPATASSFFEETWHFRKDERNKWIVAGVQQA